MEKNSGHTLKELAVDGGMNDSDLCVQVPRLRLPSPLQTPSTSSPTQPPHHSHNPQAQADLASIPILRPQMREITALGAAIAAGFAVGVWEGFDESKNINVAGRTNLRHSLRRGWQGRGL